MYEVKQSNSHLLPVKLRNATTGAPLTGITYSQVTATVLKADASAQTLTIGSGHWSEISVGAFAGSGFYTLFLPTTATDVVGRNIVMVTATGALEPVPIVFDVVAYTAFDLMDSMGTNISTILSRVGNPPWAGSLTGGLQLLLAFHQNKRKKFEDGVNANKLIIYDSDGETPLYTFAMRDDDGNGTFDNPVELSLLLGPYGGEEYEEEP